ncbi:hypothetical protein N1F89_17005 [Aquibium sp. A9E412]|uniref:hypothetical protein n=1 Tax=Aquibium sp. A9E412 TaxID=2976767 RepID=UPI0025B01908|nr:hypothetical protein [Aquibium sp. A9E412]MDN2567924.1 hypothetical protein [Aquibium sp. A9E412]
MTVGLLDTPAINAGADILVDWLELAAFFDEYRRARMDDLAGSDRTQQEAPPDNFEDEDLEDDRLRVDIENEVRLRQAALQDAYPFELDDTGEELTLARPLDDPSTAFYLLCLIASHITKSPILLAPPDAALVTRMRNRVFQVLGTLAVAGLVHGPAVSVGYPRETKETILEVLSRAERWGSGLIPRDKPGRHAAPKAKDGGIDVIGWPRRDRPPPPWVMFGQLASGLNWVDKPADLEFTTFMDDFFDQQGCQPTFTTLIPYRVIDQLLFVRESKRHKSLCDRTQAPLHALRGLGLPAEGIELDEVGNVGQIVDWIQDYRQAALQSRVA